MYPKKKQLQISEFTGINCVLRTKHPQTACGLGIFNGIEIHNKTTEELRRRRRRRRRRTGKRRKRRRNPPRFYLNLFIFTTLSIPFSALLRCVFTSMYSRKRQRTDSVPVDDMINRQKYKWRRYISHSVWMPGSFHRMLACQGLSCRHYSEFHFCETCETYQGERIPSWLCIMLPARRGGEWGARGEGEGGGAVRGDPAE